MSKALLSQQVLTLWLFSKVGTPKRVKPTEGNRTLTTNANATMIVCANRVESIPGYCEPILRGWLDCSQGISENDALFALMDFFKALEESLRVLPIFPVEANEIVTEIASYTLREIGDAFGGIHPQEVKRWMEDEGFKVPGVFQFEKHWKVMNIETLKNAFREENKKSA
jgi:hypothetical protein